MSNQQPQSNPSLDFFAQTATDFSSTLAPSARAPFVAFAQQHYTNLNSDLSTLPVLQAEVQRLEGVNAQLLKQVEALQDECVALRKRIDEIGLGARVVTMDPGVGVPYRPHAECSVAA